MLPSTAKSIVSDSRATLRSWAAYKHQTGRLPWLSIAVHFLNWVVILSGMVFLIWCGERNHWSRWGFAGVLVLIGLPYAVFWWWLKDKVKLVQIRDGRRLAKTKTSR